MHLYARDRNQDFVRLFLTFRRIWSSVSDLGWHMKLDWSEDCNCSCWHTQTSSTSGLTPRETTARTIPWGEQRLSRKLNNFFCKYKCCQIAFIPWQPSVVQTFFTPEYDIQPPSKLKCFDPHESMKWVLKKGWPGYINFHHWLQTVGMAKVSENKDKTFHLFMFSKL